MLIAFHGQQAIKDKYLERVRRHREAGELIRGKGWDGHKGCAVGCTLEKYDHTAYETELGVPRAIARLEDVLFEQLPKATYPQWPERFLSAIEPGADLSLVMAHWFVWLLTDPTNGVIRYATSDRSREVIQKVSDLCARKGLGAYVSHEEWLKAYIAAERSGDYYAHIAAYVAADAYIAADYADGAHTYAEGMPEINACVGSVADYADGAHTYAEGMPEINACVGSVADYADGAHAYAEVRRRLVYAAADYLKQSDKLIELLVAQRHQSPWIASTDNSGSPDLKVKG